MASRPHRQDNKAYLPTAVQGGGQWFKGPKVGEASQECLFVVQSDNDREGLAENRGRGINT